MGGTLEYLSGLLGGSGGHGHESKNNKGKQLQTVELKVRMDCEGCELKVRSTLSSMKGVESVEINRKQQKVTVVGYVEASKVLKKAQSTGKKAELWPYVPYNLVAQPNVAGTYDKRAPPGYVRSAEPASAGYVATASQLQTAAGRPPRRHVQRREPQLLLGHVRRIGERPREIQSEWMIFVRGLHCPL